MPRAIGSKPAQKGDGRKRWHRSRAPPQNHDDSLSTQPAVVSQTTFDERIRAIPSMDLEALPSVIDEARVQTRGKRGGAVDCRGGMPAANTRLYVPREPPQASSRASPCLETSHFGKGDTLLVARTRFGKSIIFHAFSVLTGKITLQIIPLR